MSDPQASAHDFLARMNSRMTALEGAMRDREWDKVSQLDEALRDDANSLGGIVADFGARFAAPAVQELMFGLGTLLKRYAVLMDMLTAEQNALKRELHAARGARRGAASYLENAGT